MFVIQLPNGNLLVPESALAEGGQLMGDAYVEIGPGGRGLRAPGRAGDHRAATRRTAAPVAGRGRALQRQFAEFLASQGGDGERGGRS